MPELLAAPERRLRKSKSQIGDDLSGLTMRLYRLDLESADAKLLDMSARESAAGYVVKNGKRKAVILPIEEYEELLEDLYDLGVIASRRHEPTVPFKDVLRRLKKNAAVED